MKTIDKVVATVVCILFLCSGIFYLHNFDMYESVQSYNPVGGFAALADKLSDSEWVAATCDSWPTSESPVLQSLYLDLTSVGDELLSVAVITNNRRVQVVAMMLSLTMWPVSVITSAVRAKPKEVATNG